MYCTMTRRPTTKLAGARLRVLEKRGQSSRVRSKPGSRVFVSVRGHKIAPHAIAPKRVSLFDDESPPIVKICPFPLLVLKYSGFDAWKNADPEHYQRSNERH